MDEFTQKTKTWLDKRFKKCDESGVYYAHQPIYGFRKGHSDIDTMNKYIRTYQIMRTLSHLKFDSLLDVGGAEGYKAYIAKQLFDIKVENSDLSEEACRRAEEIFSIESIPADIHRLPFKNSAFDVVLCSETLEHVADWHKAIDELLRVASKAVVITVPHQPKEVVDKHIEEEMPHGHVHIFDLESLKFLKSEGYHVLSRKMISPLLRIPTVVVEAMPVVIEEIEALGRPYREYIRKYPRILIDTYNACVPILRRLFGERTAAFLIGLDDFLCRFTSLYNAIVFVILKDATYYTKEETLNISADQTMSFAVPYHYLKRNWTSSPSHDDAAHPP